VEQMFKQTIFIYFNEESTMHQHTVTSQLKARHKNSTVAQH